METKSSNNQETSQKQASDQHSAATSKSAGNQREENSAKDPAGMQSAKPRMWGILQIKKKNLDLSSTEASSNFGVDA